MKAIIFDFNGTLFSDDAFHYKAWNRILQELTGERLTQELLMKMQGKNNQQIIAMIAPGLKEEESFAYSLKKEDYYREACLKHPEALSLVKGATDLFKELQEDSIPFTIVTASIEDNIDFFFDVFTLDHWFDRHKVIYDDGRFANKKDMFTYAIKCLGTTSKDVIVFEDSHAGIQYALEAGIKHIVGVGSKDRFPALRSMGVETCISDFTQCKRR